MTQSNSLSNLVDLLDTTLAAVEHAAARSWPNTSAAFCAKLMLDALVASLSATAVYLVFYGSSIETPGSPGTSTPPRGTGGRETPRQGREPAHRPLSHDPLTSATICGGDGATPHGMDETDRPAQDLDTEAWYEDWLDSLAPL